VAGEFDALAEAVNQHARATRDYIFVENQLRAGLPPLPRRRRWSPLLAVLMLVLCAPLAVVGRAHFVPAPVTGGSSSAWPDASNTGPPAGTTLTTWTGGCIITTPNTVIDSKIVNCSPNSLTIQAANVTISKSVVNDGIWLDPSNPSYNGAWSMTVTDSIVDGGDHDLPGICCARWVITRTEMYGGHNGAQCDGGISSTIDAQLYCTMQDSYIHGQYQPQNFDSHLGGFLTDGGVDGIQLIHNYVVCDAVVNNVGGGCSGDINLIPNFGPITNITIRNNKMGANVDTPYCTLGGEKSVSSWPHSTGVVYQDNVFEKGVTGVCGGFGPWSDWNLANTGNVWTNNRYDDGTLIAGS
jgi:hypothetical protein